jgi:hypothetical protein
MKPLHYTPSGIESYNNQITNHTPVNIIRSETIRGGVNIALIASFREYIKVNGYPEPKRYTEQKRKIKLHSTYPCMELHTTDHDEDGTPHDVWIYVYEEKEDYKVTDLIITKIVRGRTRFNDLESLEQKHGEDIVTEIKNLIETRIEEINNGLWEEDK